MRGQADYFRHRHLPRRAARSHRSSHRSIYHAIVSLNGTVTILSSGVPVDSGTNFLTVPNVTNQRRPLL